VREQRESNVVVVQCSFGRRGSSKEEMAEGKHGFNIGSHAATDVIYRVHNPRNNAEEGRNMLSCPDKSIMSRWS
jgi:hypothetical protein